MFLMPTLHIRNVPVDLYDRLREAAQTNGRSLNAEVLVCLARALGTRQDDGARLERFEARRTRMRAALADVSPAPEELIRFDRESR